MYTYIETFDKKYVNFINQYICMFVLIAVETFQSVQQSAMYKFAKQITTKANSLRMLQPRSIYQFTDFTTEVKGHRLNSSRVLQSKSSYRYIQHITINNNDFFCTNILEDQGQRSTTSSSRILQ